MSHALTGHNRPQQVIEAIQTTNAYLASATRQAKYAQMASSPYRFFTHTPALYWGDVWHDWRFALFGGWPETQTWLHGRADTSCIAGYGHHDDPVRYGLDDFDSALVGDYQYDVWRLAISVVLAGRDNITLSPNAINKALKMLLESYHTTLKAYVEGESVPDISLKNANGPLKPFMEKIADKQSRARMLAKWTTLDGPEGRRFAERPGKLANLPADIASQLRRLIEQEYQQTLPTPVKASDPRHFRVKDTARRLDADTDALGVERYYVLIEGNENQKHDDVILEVKEQTLPYAYYLMSAEQKRAWRRLFPNDGIRHAAAFHASAEHADPYLGWLTMNDKLFSVRERSSYKKVFPTHKLSRGKSYRKLAGQWGEILACHHLRGAKALHQGDATCFAQAVCQRLAGHEAAFIDMVSTLAISYADCVEQDHRLFMESFIVNEDF